MPHKRKLAQTAVLGVAAGLSALCILGAIDAPTGVNIAAALTISLGLLIEAPLTAMALGKFKNR